MLRSRKFLKAAIILESFLLTSLSPNRDNRSAESAKPRTKNPKRVMFLRILNFAKSILRFKSPHQVIFILVLAVTLLGTSSQAADKNKLTIGNQSGEDTAVKIIGPREWILEIPAGEERTILLPAGNYRYLVRYGAEANYRYTRGTPFQIEQTRVGFTEASITLISSPGQIQSNPLLVEEFNKPVAGSPGPVAGSAPLPTPDKIPGKPSSKNEFILHRVAAGDTLPSIIQWYSGEADFWPEAAKYNPNLDPLRLKPGTTVKIPIYLAIAHQSPPEAKTAPPSRPPPKKNIPKSQSPPPTSPRAPEGGFGPK